MRSRRLLGCQTGVAFQVMNSLPSGGVGVNSRGDPSVLVRQLAGDGDNDVGGGVLSPEVIIWGFFSPRTIISGVPQS